MNIKEFPQAFELKAKDLRDLAKEVCRANNTSKEKILNTFSSNSKIIDKEAMFNFFIENGLFEQNKTEPNKYSATVILRSLAGASLAKRKNSDNAWIEVAKLLARTVVLSNDNDWSFNTPSKLFLFGSMLNPNKKDYGDADLVLISGRKDIWEVLDKKQKSWLKKYGQFTSSNCYGEFGFSDERQLDKDICFSSNFPSIHFSNSIESLTSIPSNKDNFPIITLWENPYFFTNKSICADPHTDLCIQRSNEWKNKNPNQYNEIISKLNKALNSLGMTNFDSPDFEQSCKDYMVEFLTSEFVKKMKPDLKHYGDSIIIDRMVRFGSVGFEAIGRSIEQSATKSFDVMKSKLLSVLKIKDEIQSSCIIKGFNYRNDETEQKLKTMKLS